jgi:aquaporin Z
MMVLLAEFLGTFALLSAILFTGSALWIGATLAFVIYAIGTISGGHVNPAVSFAFFMKGSLTMQEFLSYAVAQLAGAYAALYAYRMLG